MTAESIVDRVLSIVRTVAGPERTPPSAGPETPLADGGFWLDSVELLEVIIACEEAHSMDFDPDTDVTPETLSTVATLASVIERRTLGS